MPNSNRGGARPGAGRPKLKVVKALEKPDCEWMLVPVPLPMWQEFCEAAHDTLAEHEGGDPRKSDYIRLADLCMIDGIHRYIKSKKRKGKKNEQ